MVDAAEGDREFVADFATEGAWLSEPKVVGIGGLPAAHKQGCAATYARWSLSRLRRGLPSARSSIIAVPRFEKQIRAGRYPRLGGLGLAELASAPSRAATGLERLLNGAGVLGRQRVLLGQNCDGPRWSGPPLEARRSSSARSRSRKAADASGECMVFAGRAIGCRGTGSRARAQSQRHGRSGAQKRRIEAGFARPWTQRSPCRAHPGHPRRQGPRA